MKAERNGLIKRIGREASAILQYSASFCVNNVMKKILFAVFLAIVGLSSCIEDGFTTSPNDQPTFSVDTLNMGLIFTEQVSTTHRFIVHNRASKGLMISNISFSGDNADLFRLNIDGFSGREFSNVEIRANDSIFVLVSVTLPANEQTVPVDINASLDFQTNGVKQSVVVTATGRDVVRLRAVEFDADTRLAAGKPYQVFDSLVVKAGVTLTVDPGVEFFFHDGAYMVVRGSLRAVGAVDKEIQFAGDRTGNVAGDISFDLMSRQWTGIFFTSTSHDNEMSYCHVRNTWQGVTVDGSMSETPVSLKMINTRLRNSGGYALEVYHADINAYGCEFAEAASGVVLLHGGRHVFNHCTLANYYLFSALGGATLQFSHIDAESDDASGRPMLVADLSNTIIYGNGVDISHGDLTGTSVYLRRCLLKSAGSDDDNFLNCLWDTDPLYYTVRADYYFDYRLRNESPAIAAADPALTAAESAIDRYGLSRGAMPELGAYVYVPAENEAQ